MILIIDELCFEKISTQPFLHCEQSKTRDPEKVFLECRCPRLQLATFLFLPRAMQCGQKEAPDQLTLKLSHSVSKPAKPYLGEVRWYTCEAETVQFYRWYAISAPRV